MNATNIINQLQRSYPGKNIVLLPIDKPTEIVLELEPTSQHPDYSVAIAVIDQSQPHFHKRSTEIYEVLRGNLSLSVNGVVHQLTTGERITILPNTIHSIVGDAVWVKCTSQPGWRADDHLVVSKNKSE